MIMIDIEKAREIAKSGTPGQLVTYLVRAINEIELLSDKFACAGVREDHMWQRLRLAEEVCSFAGALLAEEGAMEAVSHYTATFLLRDAYDKWVKNGGKYA